MMRAAQLLIATGLAFLMMATGWVLHAIHEAARRNFLDEQRFRQLWAEAQQLKKETESCPTGRPQ